MMLLDISTVFFIAAGGFVLGLITPGAVQFLRFMRRNRTKG